MAIPEFTQHYPGAIIRYIMEACSRMGCEEAAADVYCRSGILWDDLSNRFYIKIETRDDRKYIHYFDSGEAIIESDLVRLADEVITPKSQEEIDRENKMIELERIMKDKIKAAKDEYALAVKQMQEEEKAQSLVRRENEAATKWRVRYQACVDAGFTEEQAWKMMMQDIQA